VTGAASAFSSTDRRTTFSAFNSHRILSMLIATDILAQSGKRRQKLINKSIITEFKMTEAQ
jgi:hypothetical protein